MSVVSPVRNTEGGPPVLSRGPPYLPSPGKQRTILFEKEFYALPRTLVPPVRLRRRPDGFIRENTADQTAQDWEHCKAEVLSGRNITKKPWQAASTSAAACMAKGIPTLKTASRRPEPTPRRIADGIGLHERIRHRLALPIGRSSSDTASLPHRQMGRAERPSASCLRLGFSALARHPFPGTT